jgi:hypothetical protein
MNPPAEPAFPRRWRRFRRPVTNPRPFSLLQLLRGLARPTAQR